MSAPLRTLTSLLLLCLLAGCVHPLPARLVSGPISGVEHWQGKVQVAGDVLIEAGATLVIAPGTEVQFLPGGAADRFTEHPHFPGSELIVRGTIEANGTAQEPILFTAADRTAAAGSWGGINLQDGAFATFSFCLFRQADSAVHSQESIVRISESIFERNLVAVRFHSSDLRVERSLLRDNGVAIRFHFGAPVIRDNIIRANGKGIFVTAHPRDYLITGNVVSGSHEANVVLGEEVPDDLVLADNYWGEIDASQIEAGFFDGRRVDYLGRVRFLPLLLESPPRVGPSWNH